MRMSGKKLTTEQRIERQLDSKLTLKTGGLRASKL
jgi:hypothetical protein